MRKLLSVFCALVCFAFAAGGACAQSVTPPGIEKGWNLISAPCDVTLAELKQKLGNDKILVFDWDGAKYVQVDAMERGRGYLLNSNAVLNSSVVCKQGDTVQAAFSKQFRQGWNLIGNPYHKSVTFTKMLGAAAAGVTDIYEYQGNKLREVELGDKAKPFRGYWIFSTAAFTVEYPKEDANGCASADKKNTSGGEDEGDSEDDCEIIKKCDKLVVLAGGKADAPVIQPGDSVALTASCVKGETTTDVTADSKWSVDDASVLIAGDKNGAYTGAAEGRAVVTAEYDSATGSIAVTVKKKVDEIKLLKISLTAAAYDLKIGAETKLTATGVYSDGSSKDLTADASYLVNKSSVGAVKKGTTTSACDPASEKPMACSEPAAVFYANGAGSATVTASFEGVVSAGVKITVIDWLQKLSLKTAAAKLEPHETTLLSVYATYRSGKVVNVTKDAAWTVSPDAMAAVEQSTGRLTPLNLGTVTVAAAYGGLDSNVVTIVIEPKYLRWTFIQIADDDPDVTWLPCPQDPKFKYCYTHIAMKLGKTAPLYVYGEYADDSENWLDADKLSWEVTDKNIVTVDANGVITAKSEGLAGVRVYADGVYSEWFWFYVYTAGTKDFLTLEFSNEETIVEKGKSINIGVTKYTYNSAYNYFSASNVTGAAEWVLTDTSKGSIAAGIFTSKAIGDTDVSAKYNGLTSNSTTLRTWEPSHLTYCDENNVNEQSWRDGLSIASVESDCKTYKKAAPVNVRFLAQLDGTVNRRVLDVCLDLYIYDKDQNLVRTFQNRNCSPTALFKNVSGYKPVYDYTAEWDQKDDAGNVVPPGEYTAVSRYYILYCPVLKVKFTIE